LATKTLYQVLEVAQSATPGTIDAAFRAISARLRVRAGRDPEGAAVFRIALEEAYRTLSSEELRKRYDATLAPRPLAVEYVAEERSWISRNAFLLIVIGMALGGGYAYHRQVEKDRAAAANVLREKEELLARQKAEQDEAQRRQAESAQLRQQRFEDAKHQVWVDQIRRDSAAHARQQEYQRIRAEQEAARQQRMEDMAKQREEAQARTRLEQDKRQLERLEQQNYGYRRY
jgi:curved DNA-binding protein CbpA